MLVYMGFLKGFIIPRSGPAAKIGFTSKNVLKCIHFLVERSFKTCQAENNTLFVCCLTIQLQIDPIGFFGNLNMIVGKAESGGGVVQGGTQ